ncbi:MAG: sporulation protein YtfJ, partial [Clostridia bacterium]|nr:sporulation protein YtfJ [Clostridia bacterium]
MNNQIREIVDSAVANLSRVAEVNTIIGDAIVTADGKTIMPISQLNFVFVAGGGEYGKADKKIVRMAETDGYFAGASGGGATLTPVGFLVVSKDGVEV